MSAVRYFSLRLIKKSYLSNFSRQARGFIVATLKEIIQREVNPFDSVTFTTGNFWTDDKQSSKATVESIHQSAITQIETILQSVIKDNHTRSVLLAGDSGCGKSYLLSRLKKTLNDRAFFVYIEPCLVNDYIWRHTLRHTVDGLMHVPEGEKESQLLLWLKGLCAYKDNGIKKWILGAKNHFIHELRSIYPAGIYQPRDFFTVLYSLANPDLYFSACDWLRGNSISEEELKLLGVGSVIDTEEAAKGIIANFGRISTDNKPIVLCFDQVELSAKLPDSSLDISPIFNVNTAFHNNNLKNFLVIVSIVRDIWMSCQRTIPQADLARIQKPEISLKQINLEQVKALWASRLAPIHAQVSPKPSSHIAPLDEQKLVEKYPGGKANLRASLSYGGILYEESKKPDEIIEPKPDIEAAFKLLWQDQFNKTKNQIKHIRQLSSPELVEMLMTAMRVFRIEDINPRLLSGTYASYSCSYRSVNQSQAGILWNEDSNLRSFCNAMKACVKALESKRNVSLTMIRSESVGTIRNRGYQIYEQIFTNSSHRHIKASLESVHYLKTYQKLVNDARSGDLVLNFAPLQLTDLEKLVRETEVLHQCTLLRDLEIVSGSSDPEPQPEVIESTKPFIEVKEFLLNLVKHHHILGQETLIQQAKSQFLEVETAEIATLIEELDREQKISVVNPDAKPQERSICLIPQAVAGKK